MLADPKKTREEIVKWIADFMNETAPGCDIVVGISGGKDSSVTAALCAEAIGKDHVIGVMMPNGTQSDIADSQELADFLGIKKLTVNIGGAFQKMTEALNTALSEDELPGVTEISRNTVINLPPRLRMAVLYAVAQSLPNGGRVVNTCNASEDHIGYSTKFGDAAGDFSPLANLLVHEVIQIGEEMGLPGHLVRKVPADGLSGMSDEEKIGFTYAVLDHYILTGECEDEEIRKKIDRMHKANLHKLQPMPTYHLVR